VNVDCVSHLQGGVIILALYDLSPVCHVDPVTFGEVGLESLLGRGVHDGGDEEGAGKDELGSQIWEDGFKLIG
jgi:hypothetical protein